MPGGSARLADPSHRRDACPAPYGRDAHGDLQYITRASKGRGTSGLDASHAGVASERWPGRAAPASVVGRSDALAGRVGPRDGPELRNGECWRGERRCAHPVDLPTERLTA